MSVAAVIIGRNEGARLERCLESVAAQVDQIVYVDSGSTDGSIAAAKAISATVIELDMNTPFTAARARNAGLDHLNDLSAPPQFVQVIDGDCELQDGWIEKARDFLEAHPGYAIVTGRLRERFPDASVWNRLADFEWNAAAGDTDAVGGIAMLRTNAIAQVNGYRADLIAGEEPELCLRLRRAGWKIHRLPDEMALHDIAMTRVGQWWKRARRAGYTYAEGAALYWSGPERYNRARLYRTCLWGIGIPLLAIGLLVHSAQCNGWPRDSCIITTASVCFQDR